jgi:hypothetical protein
LIVDGDGELRAVARAASRFVGQLLDQGQPASPLHWAFESDADHARLPERELGWIADGQDPLRIAMHLAILRTARDACETCRAIRALPETLPKDRAGRDGAGVTGTCPRGGRLLH